MDLPTVLRDTREKEGHGYRFIKCDTCAGMEVAKLDFGDYAIKGHLDLIVIERKQSVSELTNNLGKERERFEAELQRIVNAGVKFRFVIVEDYYSSIFRQSYSHMHPNAIFESIHALEIKFNIHFIFAGNAEMAHKITRSLLLKAHKYRQEGLV